MSPGSMKQAGRSGISRSAPARDESRGIAMKKLFVTTGLTAVTVIVLLVLHFIANGTIPFA